VRDNSHAQLVKPFARLVDGEGPLTVAMAPEGYDALIVKDLLRARQTAGLGTTLVHIARDDARATAFHDALKYFDPDLTVLEFPAWDCLPYDRVSPKPEIVSRRLSTLGVLERIQARHIPAVVVTTVNAVLQRVPPRRGIKASTYTAAVGNAIDLDALIAFLVSNGYHRASTVVEPGDFAVRGGLIDIFPSGRSNPVRLDLFGDILDSIRVFDAESQKSLKQRQNVTIVPASETPLDEASISRFRQAYVATFGTVLDEDPLYDAVSRGQKHPGMEHWLPLFYDRLETFFDYLNPGVIVSRDHLSDEAAQSRTDLIADYYQARRDNMETARGLAGAIAYKALPPDALYLSGEEWRAAMNAFPRRDFTPFNLPDADDVYSAQGRQARNFAAERAQEGTNVFDVFKDYITPLVDRPARKGGKSVILASWSAGSAERTQTVLADHGLNNTTIEKTWASALAGARDHLTITVLALEHGFETPDLVVVSEQDLLGDRLIRKQRRRRRSSDFIADAATLSEGDLVVHVDHGIGRFIGLKTVEVSGAPHDCLQLEYAGGDRLYLPVENIELLSRFGSEAQNAQLDKLGGSGWQARKSKLKQRLREMADDLIKIAAARELKKADIVTAPEGLYNEFCARFSFEETEDQLHSITDVMDDLGKGRPMDRLVCGDVGFGKTEVALRAAFVTAMAGHQVAVVSPTTLLARQHHKTFAERFEGWPVKVRQLSRLVPAKEAAAVRAGLASGDIDIVIGTHALLGKAIKFADLGLLIVDEEQHFGVGHKERLKQLRANVHVLTMTATPIPRTLQLAMTGIRDLSLIATPPVDRLAVRSYITPFDPVVIREALLREKYRGGQSFYVCPRIADLGEIEEFLRDQVPEVKFAIAHGQMPTGQLEDVMTAFYDGAFDVLLSTTIVESGLDVPTANTLIVHRSDMFGLAQMYQLRGRIGRSKVRAYAYFTLPANRRINATAEKRLKVLQSLDTLGAGFTLASHDLDIRGAGNLLGDEQSGHIREVGIELYQNMLEEAVASLRADNPGAGDDHQWSPQINLGTSVLIPEDYVEDLDLRLSLYRRLSNMESREDVDAFAAELIDRFGPLPEEVSHLLDIVEIKVYCRSANIAKIDAGPKGATLAFRNDVFPNPQGLLDYIAQSRDELGVRPDQTLVYKQGMPDADVRLRKMKHLVKLLNDIATDVSEAA